MRNRAWSGELCTNFKHGPLLSQEDHEAADVVVGSAGQGLLHLIGGSQNRGPRPQITIGCFFGGPTNSRKPSSHRENRTGIHRLPEFFPNAPAALSETLDASEVSEVWLAVAVAPDTTMQQHCHHYRPRRRTQQHCYHHRPSKVGNDQYDTIAAKLLTMTTLTKRTRDNSTAHSEACCSTCLVNCSLQRGFMSTPLHRVCNRGWFSLKRQCL